jgi:hypothetical protein
MNSFTAFLKSWLFSKVCGSKITTGDRRAVIDTAGEESCVLPGSSAIRVVARYFSRAGRATPIIRWPSKFLTHFFLREKCGGWNIEQRGIIYSFRK